MIQSYNFYLSDLKVSLRDVDVVRMGFTPSDNFSRSNILGICVCFTFPYELANSMRIFNIAVLYINYYTILNELINNHSKNQLNGCAG